MEHSTEKTELPKRRVFHEHIILLIEGRLLMLLFLSLIHISEPTRPY